MKLKTLFATGLILTFHATTSNAALDGLLNNMYINVTAPDYTTSQFRGTLSGGSLYMRVPQSNIQLFSMDPPRYSAGCGSVDPYMGSFSFLKSAQLTQFLRDVAQNVPPLLFQMAVAQMFPQLDAAVKKFQTIAQDMNSQQINSCQMARGLIDAAKNPAAAMADLQEGISNGMSKLKGWADDIADAANIAVTQPSKATDDANALTNGNGTKEVKELGNITWNALMARTWSGGLLNLADTEANAQQIVMSMIGTEVRKGGGTATTKTQAPPYAPIIRLSNLVAPEADNAGNVSIPIWSCASDMTNCMTPASGSISSYGIKGFVNLNMLGSHTATAPQPGSIVYQITYCSTPGCGLSLPQKAFLNSISKVPVIALLLNAQRNPNILGSIVPRLMEEMVDEVSVLYSSAVIQVVQKLYSETMTPKPSTYDSALANMYADLRAMQLKTANGIERLNQDMMYIDAANRSMSGALGYRIKR